MKYLLVALIAVTLLSCGTPNLDLPDSPTVYSYKTVFQSRLDWVDLIEIDGCEYLLYRGYNKGAFIHKATCKNKMHVKP